MVNIIKHRYWYFLFSLLIIVRHRANIVRLWKGTEPKIGQREIQKAHMPGEMPRDK